MQFSQLFRVLIPTWRFFDQTIDAPILWYRLSSDGGHFGEWIECLPKTGPRSWSKLLINTRENYLFAAHALVEHLKDDFEESKDPSVSLALVRSMVEHQIKNATPVTPARFFQFKLDEVYHSPIWELSR